MNSKIIEKINKNFIFKFLFIKKVKEKNSIMKIAKAVFSAERKTEINVIMLIKEKYKKNLFDFIKYNNAINIG